MVEWFGRKVCITGGLGFIGSNLAIRLLHLGARVTVVDSLLPNYGGTPLNLRGFTNDLAVHILDIRDTDSLRPLLKGQEVLFHLAAQTSHMDSMSAPLVDQAINSAAHLALLELCRHDNPDIITVYTSTRQVYGRPDYLPVDEAHPIRPPDINGIHKRAGEMYQTLYQQVYGLRSCTLRLTNTIGPRMRIADARQTFVGIWLRCVLEGKPFQVWGGEQLRDFTAVDDCVDALLRAAVVADGGVYNLSGVGVLSLKELADSLIAVAGRGAYEIREFPPERKKIDIGDCYSDASLAAQHLDWVPKIDVPTALKQCLDYFTPCWQEYCP